MQPDVVKGRIRHFAYRTSKSFSFFRVSRLCVFFLLGAVISVTPITHQPINAIPNYWVHTLTWDRSLSLRSFTSLKL